MASAAHPTYTLRDATLDDVPLLCEHRVAMFTDAGMAIQSDPAELHASFSEWVVPQIKAGVYLGWIIEADHGTKKVPASSAGLVLLPWPPGYLDKGTTRAYFLNMYTYPEHRGRKLASMLTERAIQECKTRSIRVLSLHYSDAGRHVYEKLGFKVANEMQLIVPLEGEQ